MHEQPENETGPPPHAAASPAAPVHAGFGEPQFPAMPRSPADWRYHPPATASWWHRHRRTVRALTLTALFGFCTLVLAALVRQQTGTLGLFVGLGLALLPVPLLVAAFRWLDGVEPGPWRNHVFAFAWGACAAALVALLANTLATDWLSSSPAVETAREADTLGSTVVAPVVEESAKAVAVLALYLFRRRHFAGVVSGLATAGITATGFAFTENVLYLGTAFGEDQLSGPQALHESVTAMTFFVRVVLAPFAHPVFTAFTGIAFGILAAVPGMRRPLRLLIPGLGVLTAMLLHAIWNASSTLPGFVFLAVYALFMIPVFTALTWLALWSRRNQLATIRDTLPVYVRAGWLDPPEPPSLASMRARALARDHARSVHGPAAARTVAEYQHFATALALLRARSQHGTPAPDFQAREQELLHHLWHRRPLAAPATVRSAHAVHPRLPRQRAGPPGAYGG